MGEPKALLDWQGLPLAMGHANAAVAAGCERVIVVTRASCKPALDACRPSSAVTMVTADAPDPRGSALVAWEASGATERDTCLVTPVDLLPPSLATLSLLLDALASQDCDAVTPSYRGRAGHPIVCRGSVLASLRVHPSLRDALRALGPRRAFVDVDDPHVVQDFDTREEWRRATTIDSSTKTAREARRSSRPR